MTTADRVSNDSMYITLQKVLFERYGLLYERKRGEFSDGVEAGYVDQSQILERNLFLRLFLASQGALDSARRRRIFAKHDLTAPQLTDAAALDLFHDSYVLFRRFNPKKEGYQPRYGDVLVKVYLGVSRTDKALNIEDRAKTVEKLWADLSLQIAKNRERFISKAFDRATGETRDVFSREKWIASHDFEADVREFVGTGQITPKKKKNARNNDEVKEEFS